MKLWNSFSMMQTELAKTAASGLVVTIGNFDGVHRGHQKILARVKELGRAHGWLAVVVTFRDHTAKILKGEAPGLLLSVEERCARFAALGIDGTLLLDFTPELAAMEPTPFLDQLLALGVRALVVGHDFRFGIRGTGDTNLILTYMQKHGCYSEVVPPVKVRGRIVSSTQIRTYLQQGELEAANEMIGRPFSLSGIVSRGQGLGRVLGFPTANLSYPAGRLLPKFGAYFVRVFLNAEVYYGLANVGCKPTFDHCVPLVEVFIDQFSREIYGEFLTVEFLHFLREERKFASPEALKAQLLLDRKQGEELRRRILAQKACN
ncbi:MAG TPA: bifunctional riboflavin kinase/FAD synthetase [Firmicutes bacterium]|uniref:Riboflavin biosynthesis protein n=1 Tax=Capillibacterium thermochitinicola TaxID=2699427 RepID=A0A8J6I1R1_9FIRM|nr:bifunctional riboflavin kinase/FAD synthetase [Capillibacterium thermochitinicola]MBA2133841.1 bifunctional riboflavin kinase/FAD synthetase [Capillibacterium thermochitinicola]HHW11636.1 bifunctional riboflavin kinase/FAD synthetase [Bacillota bacterium]